MLTKILLRFLDMAWVKNRLKKLPLSSFIKMLTDRLDQDQFLIPTFKPGLTVPHDRYSYQKKYVDFGITKGEKVLDIGSGSSPFPEATHLADLFIEETTHRARQLTRDERPFIQCNVENLPFKDKEFDFVYCSHLLEHVNDPAKACEEIMRIGKRGYIETPTRLSDVMLNFIRLKDHHQWFVSMAKNTLFFLERNEYEKRDLDCNQFFMMLHSKYENPFQTLFLNNHDLFCNMLLWEGRFDYYVFGKDGALLNTNKREHVLQIFNP